MKFDNEFKEAISHLPDKEKDKLILRLLKKDLNLANRLHFELVSTITVEERRDKMKKRIIAEAKNMGERFYSVGYLNMEIRSLSGEISEHVQITKDKIGEASLNLLLLLEVLKYNNNNIILGRPAKVRKLCIAIIARVFKILILINKMHEDYLLEFEENLRDLGLLIGENSHLMKFAIQHGLDVNWLIQGEIPDDIIEIHKDLKERGYLSTRVIQF
ncbi:hypothetical protein RM545_10905 [Zunongwangia sp. F260]|uniref:Uncharacterized protein n=1 Tax=Autumnicola lenta TaxID=3075593 RepID=A0ABU3CLH9_9FLAO|nr:hypothetical protein [Zunongwangia sp. F260]MDT0647198.1 hypothetical protein [Zunongwangia sp. F260]